MKTNRADSETLAVNRIIRSLFPYSRNLQIVIVDGDKAPTIEGEYGYFTTPSGKTIISHPNAYKWPKVYHRSTRRIDVGRGYWEAVRTLLRVAPLAEPEAFLARIAA